MKIGSGKEAAAAVVGLMKDTFSKIEPSVIVNAYISDPAGFVDSFWKSKGKTVLPILFANGANTLASLWNSAWELGQGSKNIKDLGAVDSEEIVTLYQDPEFLPSVDITGIQEYLH